MYFLINIGNLYIFIINHKFGLYSDLRYLASSNIPCVIWLGLQYNQQRYTRIRNQGVFSITSVKYLKKHAFQNTIMTKKNRMSNNLNELEPLSPRLAPYETEAQEGRPYLWYACGHSNSQPFCDGAHRSTSFLPLVHHAKKTEKVYFCGCKQTKTV